MKLSADQVNYLNIGLMLASVSLAFIIPFELFLFSYAVLGPLHYLTEISWLHDRNYFTEKKQDYLWLIGLSILILLGSKMVLNEYYVEVLSGYSTLFTMLAFGLALVFILSKEFWTRIYLSIAVIIGALIVNQENLSLLLFSVYLPTLIHVYVFTGAFVLFGALKSKSKSGILSFFVFLACPLLCIFLFPNVVGYELSGRVRDGYMTFSILNEFLVSNYLGELMLTQRIDVFNNEISILFTRFIAFAYTYHYLNWFSKTSVIKWHEVPRLRFAVVIVIWIASIVLYGIDYKLGFVWLFLLSFMHVFLEFPLNHRSFVGIGQELKKRMTETLSAPK